MIAHNLLGAATRYSIPLLLSGGIGFVGLMASQDAAAQTATMGDWTGCYVGGYGGAALGASASTVDLGDGAGLPWNPPLGNRWSQGLGNSAIAGGTAGCFYQTHSPVALGLEVEGGYLRLSGAAAAPVSPGHDTVARFRVGDWYAVLAPRVGWSFGTTLLYLKGGGVLTEARATVADTCTVLPCAGGALQTAGNATRLGWTVGSGLEYALDERWAIKAEYLYLGLEDDVTSCGTATAGLAAGSRFCFRHKSGAAHTAKLGISYRFWTFGGP